ncbi:imidazolonepropionase-like amidohydrolase [Maribacter caenipelagi]|uniref:Imidazolonepropionase-like amidohydrolase n=1 Tax=Maribacter caenipelagi TaxID=1447781 RepID=A0A4R7CZZ0_9FLAO|nr:amidohydrolase family protein [Maribacter caenipelagi]TDS12046.1 imidazolonepropionase-like amidohydrolase [Maribacter caenipelagi]
MKQFLSLLLLLTATLSTIAQSKLIKADSYLDVRTGKLISPANLLIENGTIKSINPKTLPEGVETVDLSGKILLPGLMDMHVHLDGDFRGSWDYIYKESASQGTVRAVVNAEKTLMAGFTTIRSIGQLHITPELIDVAVSEASNKGMIAAPRIIPSGHMISINGGHGDISLGLAEGLVTVGPNDGIINGKYDAIEAVRYQIKHGAKFIKMHATAGVLSMEDAIGAQQLSNEEMKTIVDEASRHHIKVAAHAHGTKGIKEAIKAGVYSIEHGSIIDDEGIQLMKENNVYLVPTRGLATIIEPMIDKMDPVMAGKAKYVMPIAKQNLTKAIKADVKIAFGTDTPIIPHGKNAIEFAALIECGMSTKEAIKTATTNSAEMLGLTDRGEVKEGLLADLIAVDTNPIDDITTLEHVKFVMKDGVVYKNKK